MSVILKVTGVKEIDNVLKGMPLQLTDRVLQNASAAASKPLVEEAKLTAPEGPTGYLVDSIGVVRSRSSSIGNRELGLVKVGPRRGGKYRGYHAHLVEYGTGQRRNKKGANRGRMPAQPFMGPSFKAKQDKIRIIYNDEVGKKLYSFMRRTIKRAGV